MNQSIFPDTSVFRGYGAPSRVEAAVSDLEIIGSIPAELNGSYIRISADHRYPPIYADDIFINGDGIVHKVRLHEGRADLQTRYVRTNKFSIEAKAGRALFGSYRNPYTSDPSVREEEAGTANTSAVWHGGVLLVLKEAARPIRVDPVTLETLGVWDFDGALASRTFTAHPKIDPRTGEMVANGYYTKGVADKTIELYFIDREGRLERTESFEAPYPSMVHDFFVTPNYIAFAICPMTSDWERVQRGEHFFHWDSSKPTMVAVIPRRPGGAQHVRWFTAPRTAMQTHTFNAWEDGTKLHLEHFVNDSGWLSQFPDINDPHAKEMPPFAWRWTVDLDGNSDGFAAERLFPHIGEMPAIDARYLGHKTRHYWFGTSNTALGPMLPPGPKGPPFTCIGHFDAVADKLDFFYAGTDSSPEEPVFVPRAKDAAEGDGWLLTIVGRRAENRTDLVILDARNLSAGPVATIRFPLRVKEGFHGTWIPEAELPAATSVG